MAQKTRTKVEYCPHDRLKYEGIQTFRDMPLYALATCEDCGTTISLDKSYIPADEKRTLFQKTHPEDALFEHMFRVELMELKEAKQLKN